MWGGGVWSGEDVPQGQDLHGEPDQPYRLRDARTRLSHTRCALGAPISRRDRPAESLLPSQ